MAFGEMCAARVIETMAVVAAGSLASFVAWQAAGAAIYAAGSVFGGGRSDGASSAAPRA